MWSFTRSADLRHRTAYDRWKRCIDVVLTFAALVPLLPIGALAALAIRLTSRGPILFRQVRVGLDGEPFEMLKLRSMRAAQPGDDAGLRRQVEMELAGTAVAVNGSFKLADDHRTTRIGRLLRRTSLDELPQLVNVLRGEMSLVGPRPALPWEHDLFPEQFRDRVEVLPGITGLWQVCGRSALDTRQMLELDMVYVRDRTIRGDLHILGRTVTSMVNDRSAR